MVSTPPDKIIDPDFQHMLETAIGAVTSLAVLERQKQTDDSADLLVASTRDARYIIHLAVADFPTSVAEDANRTRLAAEYLGAELGDRVLQPGFAGDWKGKSYTVTPFAHSLSQNRLARWYQKARLNPHVYDWLLSVTQRAQPADAGFDQEFRHSLEAVAAETKLSSSVRNAASNSLASVQNGQLKPRPIFMHGDFWLGNILLGDNADCSDFKIIDWGGSRHAGFPVFDLITYGYSVRAKPATVKKQLALHAAALGCQIQDSTAYLLAAVGQNLREPSRFPPSRLVQMTEERFAYLEAAIRH
jgi:hypothetical protein